MKGKVEAFPGILKWLEQFQSRGAKQAITSSAPPENIEALVKALDIEGNFNVTVSGIRLARKAQPGYFLKAARATQVSPENCIVIEDVIAGVEGAKRAEMKCIAVRFQ